MLAEKNRQAFSQAVELHRTGHAAEAVRTFRKLLQREPGDADVLNMLGAIAWQEGRYEEATTLLTQAITHKPAHFQAHYNLANALRDQGKRQEAIAGYRRAIVLKPDFLSAYINLGNLLANLGRLDEAIAVQLRVVALDPNLPDAHYNLGNAFCSQEKFEASIAAFHHAIALRPDFADAFYNLGNALSLAGQPDDAIPALEQAIRLNPHIPGAYTTLASALRVRGRLDEAISVSRRAVAENPDALQCYSDLASALLEKGFPDEAVEFHRMAIERNAQWVTANNAMVEALKNQGDTTGAARALQAAQERSHELASYEFKLAALGIGEMPSTSPTRYVVESFDRHSEKFDGHLASLNYIGPQLLFDAVRAAGVPEQIDVLDLGCGTGLCGPLFRPLTRRLVGVDLSPKMLERAKSRRVYDLLKEQDITLALRDSPDSFDLILSADVFIYVGRLEAVFEAAAKALRPGGLLAFTIESTDAGDYVLRTSHRYAHSAAYIRRLASQTGFAEVTFQDCVIRNEGERPVDAKVIVLRS